MKIEAPYCIKQTPSEKWVNSMVNEIIKDENSSEDIYSSIRSFVIIAQHKVYAAVNSAMVVAYWEIGERIYKASGENDRAEYGKIC